MTEPSGRILASRVVKADEVAPDSYRAVTLDYALPDSRVLEFPIGYLGGPAVFLDRIEVSPAIARFGLSGPSRCLHLGALGGPPPA